MTPTTNTSRRRSRQPTRNLARRDHEPPPLGESTALAGAPSRAPPAAPKIRPQHSASGSSTQEPPRQAAPSTLPAGLPPPLSSPPGPGSQVMARQASFSSTWHHAVVSEVHITNGRTHASVVWDDDTTTRAIPLSRIRATRKPLDYGVQA